MNEICSTVIIFFKISHSRSLCPGKASYTADAMFAMGRETIPVKIFHTSRFSFTNISLNSEDFLHNNVYYKLNEPLSRDSGFIVIADNEGANGTSPEYVSEHVTSVVVTIRAAS